jgi:CelD/BcsL family acetyltransferase involved in cellulose biosynthesis
VSAPAAPTALVAHAAWRPASGPATYATQHLRGRAAFDWLADEWNELLARGPCDLPFVRHEWLSAWLDAFAPGENLLVVTARDGSGRLVGAAPFLRERRLGVTRLVAPANDHSCRFEWALGEDATGAAAALWHHLRTRLRWDVLLLRDLPRDGPTAAVLPALAAADGHLTGSWESMRSPWLTLGGQPVEERASAKFRANLRRRLRRLGELGAVSVRRAAEGPEARAMLAQFLELEAAGWKGARGTAIAADERTRAFYERLVEVAAARGWLALRALELDGRPVAMHLGLVYRGTYYLPKPAYDEALGACSPGQLLFREVVGECEARGLGALDLLGPDMPWKRDWEPHHRPHDWVYVYRPGLAGRTLHAVKHRVKPLAKEVLGWWR